MTTPTVLYDIIENIGEDELDRRTNQTQEESKNKNQSISPKQYFDEETQKIKTRSETIGHILKFLRKEQKLTQKAVAENIGIAQQTYAGYESGKHEPSIEIAIRLSDFYGLSLDYITGRFAGTDNENINESMYLDLILRHSLSYFARAEESNKEQIAIIKKAFCNTENGI